MLTLMNSSTLIQLSSTKHICGQPSRNSHRSRPTSSRPIPLRQFKRNRDGTPTSDMPTMLQPGLIRRVPNKPLLWLSGMLIKYQQASEIVAEWE